MTKDNKPKKVLKKPVHPNQIAIKTEMQAIYLEKWHQGYESKTILKEIGKKFFKCYQRVTQIVEPIKLTRGLTRENVKIL